MKTTNCNPDFGRTKLILLISIAIAVALGVIVVRHWAPQRVVERQQQAFIVALERRSAKRLERILADNYLDQWGFDREKAKLAVLDLGSQFLVLTLVPTESEYRMNEGQAEVVMRFEASGNGGPLAHEIIRTTNRLEEPFVFTWEKQSAWPGDWKLVRIENDDLADQLRGYEPGDFRRALGIE